MNKRRLSLLAIPVILLLFVAANVLAGLLFRSTRLDLTEERLYTLSAGARNITKSIAEPLRLDFYFSEDVVKDRPEFLAYAQRVEEYLEEFERAAAGGIRLRRLDPEPYSEAEEQATAAGLPGIPLDRVGDRLYFGLVGRNSVDDQQTIPFFSPDKESFLEYDLAKLIYTLAHPQKQKIGLLSSLPLEARFDPQNPGRPAPAWQILEQVRSLFEVEILDAAVETIPTGVDVLWIVHPKNLGEATLYAVDQFLLRGGRALVFLDPRCMVDQSGARPDDPFSGMQADKSSDLQPLLAAWGVGWDKDYVAADRQYAVSQPVQGRTGLTMVDHVFLLGLDAQAAAAGDPISGGLTRVLMGMPGRFTHLEGATTTFEPLLQTSEQSMLLSVPDKLSFFPDAARLLNDFQSSGERYVLAARVGGTLKTAYPEGRPGGAEDREDGPAAEQEDGAEEPAAPEESGGAAEHLTASSAPALIVLVADADLLHDDFWIQEERLGPISLGWRVHSDNGSLVLNALEMLGGSQDLVSIRGRRSYDRPFERVRDLQRAAEKNYLAEEQALQQEISDTEQRINEMQRGEPGGTTLILSPEQREELDKLQKTLVDSNKQLRNVQYNLRKDIEGLGRSLMMTNVLAMPAAVLLLALATWWMRWSARKGRS